MNRIKILDKYFQIFINAEQLEKTVLNIANSINIELQGENIVFIPVLNGAFMFAADLLKHIILPSQISFIKMNSYVGVSSGNEINQSIGLKENINDKTVVIIEDIIETGNTLHYLMDYIAGFNPKSIKIASLFLKPEKYNYKYRIDYLGYEIGNDFILGYGLDYRGYGRNFKHVYQIIN